MWVCDIRMESAEEGIGGNGAEGHVQRFSFMGCGTPMPTQPQGPHTALQTNREHCHPHLWPCHSLIWDLLICEVKRQSVSLSAMSDSL